MGRIPYCGRPESSSSNIWLQEKPFWCVKLCAWSHAKCLSLLALGFTHQKGLSYQIFELEDSGLPQQGILPISARKTTTKAIHRCLEKTLSTVKWRQLSPNVSWHSEQIHEIFFPTSTVPLARINSTILKVPSTDHVVGDGIAAIDTLALGVRHPGHAHMVQET